MIDMNIDINNTALTFQAAISCLTMPEQHPVKSASSFLGHLITVSREVEPLVPLVNTHGEQLFLQVRLTSEFGLTIVNTAYFR